MTLRVAQRTPTSDRWWAPLSRSARTLRVVAAVAPIVASTSASVGLALLLPSPVRPLTTLLWWLAVLGVGGAALLVVRSSTVRLFPLAALLDLSLVFPDEAPSRFAIARRARSVEEALDVLEDLGETASVQAAAEASIALVIALETHDRATRGHAERVRILADLVGQELGIDAHERVRLRWGALLHDLGKLHVHGDILNKPGRPSEDEWQQLQRHPIEGDRLVQPLRPWLGDWVNAVLEHHERFDGRGYPHGVAGDEISLAGRIVGVVDAYETMTARRAYKEASTAADARRELVDCAGSQFDPEIVRAFLSVSIPAPSRRSLLLGWLAQLPIVAWLGRLPRQPTASMLGAGVATATLVVSGLTPVPAPIPTSAPDDPPQVALDGPPETIDPLQERTPETRNPTSAPTTPPADARAAASGADGQDDADEPGTDQPLEPERTSDHRDDRTPDTPQGPGDPETDHRDATHAVATALHLGAGDSSTRWLPLLADAPPPRDVPDADHDGRPGVSLSPTASTTPTSPAWTLRVPTTVTASGRSEATLHLARVGDRQRTPVLVRILDCPSDLQDCDVLASGQATVVLGPVEAGWQEVTVPLGPMTALIENGHVLAVLVSARPTTGETLLAVGSAGTPSRVDGISLAPRNVLAEIARPADSVD